MGKPFKNQTGFGAVGVMFIIVILLLGVMGYFVYKNHNKTTTTTTTTSSNQSTTSKQSTPQPVAYKRTTTVPGDWKLYTNNTYKFSISYPASMDPPSLVTGDVTGDLSTYVVGDSNLGISIYAKPLTAEASSVKSQWVGSNDGEGGVGTLQETNMTFDGHPAIKFDETETWPDKTNAQFTSYLIYANGYTYSISDVSDSQLTAAVNTTDLTMFESLKFQ